tara:strand:- start:1490 stop:1951 length:462 start_codon:yes stop_codon:yes gene_type:complete
MNLVDDDLALHARALVRFAVEFVGTGGVKLVRDLLPWAVQVVLVGDLVSIDPIRDGVFIEDDVVRERLVVDEFNSFALGDRDGRREETEFTIVATQLDGGSKRRVDHKDSRANDGSLLIEDRKELVSCYSLLIFLRKSLLKFLHPLHRSSPLL